MCKPTKCSNDVCNATNFNPVSDKGMVFSLRLIDLYVKNLCIWTYNSEQTVQTDQTAP